MSSVLCSTLHTSQDLPLCKKGMQFHPRRLGSPSRCMPCTPSWKRMAAYKSYLLTRDTERICIQRAGAITMALFDQYSITLVLVFVNTSIFTLAHAGQGSVCIMLLTTSLDASRTSSFYVILFSTLLLFSVLIHISISILTCSFSIRLTPSTCRKLSLLGPLILNS